MAKDSGYYQDETNQWWYFNKIHRWRAALVTCDCCGKTYPLHPTILRRKQKAGEHMFCTRACANKYNWEANSKTHRGPENPAWKGGKRNCSGYIRIYSPDHPRRERRHNSVAEHRLVMEKILGRYLYPDEVVHHKNGVTDDNRPENLELWVISHPPGQRPEDVLAWAKEMINRYDPKR